MATRIFLRGFSSALISLSILWSAHSSAVTLTNIDFSSGSGDVTLIEMTFDGKPPEVSGYTIEKPARIALDMPGVTSALQTKKHDIGAGNARSATIVETKDRARLVVNLTELVGYNTQISGNTLFVRIGNNLAAQASSIAETSPAAKASTASGVKVVNVDFRRGKLGEGQIQIMLNDSRVDANIRREGNKIIADLAGVQLPDILSRRLDVSDFATPVSFVDSRSGDGFAQIVIEPNVNDFEYLAYQTDKLLSINVSKPVAEERKPDGKKVAYTGEKLSLNFQDIQVRAVLQLIADFTGLNLVASDSVTGNITLRLQNVPWDQALDLVLKTKGLGQRQMGSVLLIAPAGEIAAREKVELEAVRQVEELSPLITEYIQLNYAKASDLLTLLTSEQGLLSDRGSAVVDSRTNTLLMKDTAVNLEKVREALTMLDVPVRQVLIEARIVIANTSVGKELGVRWGGAGYNSTGDSFRTIGGSRTTLTESNQ
ncbi:MAG: secretin N-terminal domain-containing protein, partial [Oleibacter sp.]|nr:secretin N-terminal domain-containing protein [Thalassolituus sp.]